MKKVYIVPQIGVINGVVDSVFQTEHSGTLSGGDIMGKENNFTFDIEDPYELWGDESGDDDWLVDNNN